MSELALLAASGGLFMTSIVSVRWVEGDRLSRSLVPYELRFPIGTDPEAVGRFLAGAAGIAGPRWSRLFAARPVVVEVTASGERISHHLLVPRDLSGVVLAQLRAALPDVVAHEDAAYQLPAASLACELSLSDHQRSLNVDRPEAAAAAILASLQPLAGSEAVVLQTLLSPLGPVPPAQSRRAQPFSLLGLLAGSRQAAFPDREAARAARAKQEGALFRATIRLGVTAATPARARALMRQLLAPFHIVNAPGAHLRRRRLPSRWAADRLARRTIPALTWPILANDREVTAVVALPIGELHLSGLRLGQSRPFPPSIEIPSKGKVVGDAIYPGRERPLAIAVPDALRHIWVCGPTGVGKSTLLAAMIGQDIAAGHGVVVIDPKGDLITDVLERLPQDRVDDVIILDPAEADDRPVGFNSLAGSHHDPELSADQHLATLHRLWAANWGPRTQDHLHAGLLTVAAERDSTLLHLPTILTNDVFRRRLVGRVTDPVLAAFWAGYEDMSPGERAQAIGAPLNKLRQLTLRPRLRAILGQAEPTFTLQDVLNQRKVLLVSLPTGLIGEEAAALLGSLLMARLSQAVYALPVALPVALPNARPFVLVVRDGTALFTNDRLALARSLMTRLRLSAGRLAALTDQLAQRDLDLVADLSNLRLATSRQLQRLHFAEGSSLTQARRCRAALQRLVDEQVLARLDRRIGGVRAGSAGFVYALGPAGQRLNGGYGPAGGRRVRRPWTPSLPFVAHRLAVSELFVALVEQERAGAIELVEFQPEPACWRRFTGPAGNVVTLKPDAYVVTARGEYEEHRFLEVDRATESPATITAKLRQYRHYWASGREQHQRGVFPATLFVVPDQRRAAVIHHEIAAQPEPARLLFGVVVWTEAIRRIVGGGS